MYTKLLIKTQFIFLLIMVVISICTIFVDSSMYTFSNWTSHWTGILFLILYIVIFLIAIMQIIFGLLEGRISGLISGTCSIFTFIPFICCVVILINIYLFVRFMIEKKKNKKPININK